MSIDIKNLLVRTTAVKLSIHEKIVEKVVDFQFQSAREAMASNHSVEVSGFGKFVFNNNKAKKKLLGYEKTLKILEENINNPETSDKTMVFSKNVLEDTKNSIAHLKPMIKND
jgi:nucleoid DNA-binding protein